MKKVTLTLDLVPYEGMLTKCNFVLNSNPFPKLIKPKRYDEYRHSGLYFYRNESRYWAWVTATENEITISCDQGITFDDVLGIFHNKYDAFREVGWESLANHNLG
jgi:hypothetical protein